MTIVDPMKPPEGSWTQHYSELGTGLVSYEDCTSPDQYELERAAVFKNVWLMVGRVEQLPRNGSYFTKELAVAKTSVVLVRGMDGEIRAFHNICRHRGNKLVWTDYPGEETAGNCRQFACKYHGWRYDLDGSCAFVQQESEFFDLDKAEYGLVSIHCDVWEGFVFIHLGDQPRESLTEFLGPMVRGVEGYPFDLHTEHYGYQAKVASNWKLFFDAFQEYYHAPVLHANQTPAVAALLRETGFSGAYYQLDGPHRLSATGGAAGRTMHPELLKPMERLTRSGLIGPWDGPDFSDTAGGLNPAGFEEWTVSAFHLFPNTTILFRGAGWYLTYSYWPTSYNTHIFEGNLYFTPSRNARERVAHEMTRATHKEYGLQDCNTLEATQTMLESGVFSSFPLSDHEVLCRHLHKVVGEWVADDEKQQREGVIGWVPLFPAAFADLEPYAEKWCLPNEPARYAARVSSTMDELQSFYDAMFPRGEAVLDYLDQFSLAEMPEEAERLLQLMYALIIVSFPVEVFRQPTIPDTGAAQLDFTIEPAH